MSPMCSIPKGRSAGFLGLNGATPPIDDRTVMMSYLVNKKGSHAIVTPIGQVSRT